MAELPLEGIRVVNGNDDTGLHRYPGFPGKFSATSLQVTAPVARMGEHTEYGCKDIIGMSDGEYAGLKAREVIGLDCYPWAGPLPAYD